jgi:hypothetical protein
MRQYSATVMRSGMIIDHLNSERLAGLFLPSDLVTCIRLALMLMDIGSN